MASDKLNLGQNVEFAVEKKGGIQHCLFKGKRNEFFVEIFDEFGNLKYKEKFFNDITNGGKDSLLDVYFDAATQITAWYFGIVDNGSFSAFADADTMSSHAGWIEFTSYDEATRVEWAPDNPASQSITNGTARTFSINGSGTLKGIFVTSDNTKSGTAGTLWATAAFSSTVPVSNGDTLKITYTVNA